MAEGHRQGSTENSTEVFDAAESICTSSVNSTPDHRVQTGDESRSRPKVSEPSKEELLVVRSCVLNKCDNAYPMTKPRRGSCLIINNINFPGRYPRCGAQADVNRLKSLFQEFHFVVEVLTDLSAGDILRKLKSCLKERVRQQDEAFVCIISSHGAEGCILGSDGKEIDTGKITRTVTNVNCPQLLGKPKMFFIQACRGEQCDRGVLHVLQKENCVEGNDYEDMAKGYVIDKTKSITMPEHSDTYVAFSTVDGYRSIRNSEGTWFLCALYEEFARWAWTDHLESLMKRVKRNIFDRERKTADKQKSRKQSPEILLRGWRYDLYFNPGRTTADPVATSCVHGSGSACPLVDRQRDLAAETS